MAAIEWAINSQKKELLIDGNIYMKNYVVGYVSDYVQYRIKQMKIEKILINWCLKALWH